MNKKPRIALMSYAMDNRRGKGTALYTRKLIEHMLDDDRFEFFLVHFDVVDDPTYAKAREIVMPRLPKPFNRRFFRTMAFFWKYRRDRFDVIHWFQPRLYPFFWLAPADCLIATAHGAGDVTAPGEFPLSRRMFNFVFIHFNKYLAAILADSAFGNAEIVEYYRVPAAKVHTIGLGGGENFTPMDPDIARSTIQNKYGIEGRFLLDVSRHDPHKNIAALIEAYVVLRSRSTFTQKLLIVGSTTGVYEVNRALAEASAYAKDVIFLPYVDATDLNALYSAADLFAFPSLNEGFGLPIVEAFASGTPVVTSNITSMPEIAGDAALVVDPKDPQEIAAAMERVLGEGSLRKDLVARGFSRAKHFTWAMTAEATLALYLELLP